MLNFSQNCHLSIAVDKQKGRKVIANEFIQKGQLIESCPCIILTKSEVSKPLDHFVYFWEVKKEEFALVLGYGSLYNHSYTPNAKYVFKSNGICFYAIKDIKENEEITINYNGRINSKNELWFDVK